LMEGESAVYIGQREPAAQAKLQFVVEGNFEVRPEPEPEQVRAEPALAGDQSAARDRSDGPSGQASQQRSQGVTAIVRGGRDVAESSERIWRHLEAIGDASRLRGKGSAVAYGEARVAKGAFQPPAPLLAAAQLPVIGQLETVQRGSVGVLGDCRGGSGSAVHEDEGGTRRRSADYLVGVNAIVAVVVTPIPRHGRVAKVGI